MKLGSIFRRRPDTSLWKTTFQQSIDRSAGASHIFWSARMPQIESRSQCPARLQMLLRINRRPETSIGDISASYLSNQKIWDAPVGRRANRGDYFSFLQRAISERLLNMISDQGLRTSFTVGQQRSAGTAGQVSLIAGMEEFSAFPQGWNEFREGFAPRALSPPRPVSRRNCG